MDAHKWDQMLFSVKAKCGSLQLYNIVVYDGKNIFFIFRFHNRNTGKPAECGQHAKCFGKVKTGKA
jgi:hypothetical protein